jgi:hypothetical protein
MKVLKLVLSFVLMSIVIVKVQGQSIPKNNKVILITLDGLRWQELFTGADKKLVTNKDYVHNAENLEEQFWKSTPTERREVLMPFVWSTIKEKGQIHGNRNAGSKMNLTNKHWFSYPGYNEILSGKADDKRINSNDKLPNPNQTILERVHNTASYKGKVAAFGSWDVFPYIVNETRSGVPVNAGFEAAEGNELTANETYLNKLQKVTPSPWGTVRLDVFTHHYALEYMQKSHPDLLYIAYGETDDFAHDGDYESYLKSANRTDGFIEELWNFVNSDPYYKGNTTILITTDHGRGTEPLATWKSHGSDIKGTDQVWVMALGNGIAVKGEITNDEQLYTNQIAASVAKILSVDVAGNNMGKAFEFVKE